MPTANLSCGELSFNSRLDAYLVGKYLLQILFLLLNPHSIAAHLQELTIFCCLSSQIPDKL
jgi:hypothetical protein